MIARPIIEIHAITQTGPDERTNLTAGYAMPWDDAGAAAILARSPKRAKRCLSLFAKAAAESLARSIANNDLVFTVTMDTSGQPGTISVWPDDPRKPSPPTSPMEPTAKINLSAI